jgi:hypothetical protein
MSGRAAGALPGADAFPVARWLAAVWLLGWGTAYATQWGFANFLHLCDVAVILTCVGLWRGSPLLLSSQALSSLIVDVAWDLDLFWRAVTGGHLLGGTEYMWEDRFPLWLRLLSLFHVPLPLVLVWAVRRVGYDPRGLLLQAALAAVLIAASRLVSAEANVNFAHADPFFHRSWGPAPLHVAVIWGPLVFLLYWPMHRLLRRVMPRPQEPSATSR